MTKQVNIHDFYHMPVSVNTLYFKGEGKNISVDSTQVKKMLVELPHVKWVPMDDLFHSELVVSKGWSLAITNLIRAASEFVHSQLSFVDKHAYNNFDLQRLIVLYEPILKDCYIFFTSLFNPDKLDAKKATRLRHRIEKEIAGVNSGSREKDELIKTIFESLINFFSNIRKTNYYNPCKSMLSFRLDPAFMNYYDEQFPQYKESFPLERPYGVFFFFREGGLGFHIRFSKIARGGWRTVIPQNRGRKLEERDAYAYAKDEVFREVFVLAHTQHLKNKDIYEGGSKMICLLDLKERNFHKFLYEVQRSMCRAFLDLINYTPTGQLKWDNIIDLLNEAEIIEIGPDENMYDDMIQWIGKYAEDNGYCLKSGLISGKSDIGINHKHYGVTSFGVHQYLLKTLEELKINPSKDEFTLKISGGPSGDVAGNALKLLLKKDKKGYIYPNLKIVAITDGPAAIYDPNGINKVELEPLILSESLDKFDPQKLSGENAYMIFTEPTIKDGKECYRCVVRKNNISNETCLSRDSFMGLFQNNLLVNYADVFIPCGGRPNTININNWQEYCPNSIPSSKAIVEGANSFITPTARLKLEEQGVWIVKDASANKCGVITSSYEVLSGLTMSKEEFIHNKELLVSQILDILEKRARSEANWLYSEFRYTGLPMTELTEQLSHEINNKNIAVTKYIQKHPELISDEIILEHLPKLFKKRPDVISKIPHDYKIAIIAVELACRIIYGKTQNIEEEIASVCK